MKTRELLIILIVLLILLIIGLVAFLVFYLSGKSRWTNGKGQKSSQVIFDSNYQLAEVDPAVILVPFTNTETASLRQKINAGKERAVISLSLF